MAAEPPVLPGRDEAGRWAAEELAKPEYRDASPGWLEEAWRGFLDWLGSLDGVPVGGNTAAAPWIVVVIAVVIGAAVILVRPRLNAKAKRPAEMFDDDPTVTATTYRSRAAAAAATGNWDAAVVDCFRAMVRTAEERNVLEPAAGRTADEVARELARPFASRASHLGQAARTFDGIRYGNESAGSTAYAAMLELDTALGSLKPQTQHFPTDSDAVDGAPAGRADADAPR